MIRNIKAAHLLMLCFFLTWSFLGIGAMFAGMNQHEPLPGYAIAFILWVLFLRCLCRRR
jgi:hypothetical protein